MDVPDFRFYPRPDTEVNKMFVARLWKFGWADGMAVGMVEKCIERAKDWIENRN